MANDSDELADVHIDQRRAPVDHRAGAWLFTVTAVLMAVPLFLHAMVFGEVTELEVILAGILVGIMMNPRWTTLRAAEEPAGDRSEVTLSASVAGIYTVVVVGSKLFFDFPGFDFYGILWDTFVFGAFVVAQAAVLAVIHYWLSRPLVPELPGRTERDLYLTNRWRFGQLLLAAGVVVFVTMAVALLPGGGAPAGRIQFILLTASFGWGFLVLVGLLAYKTIIIEWESGS